MLALEMFHWWYTDGWAGSVRRLKARVGKVNEAFSIGLLFRTLFAPWRRIMTQPGSGLDAHMRAFGDNIISRLVGFVARFFALMAAGVAVLFVTIFSAIELLIWPLLPPASVGLLFGGLFL
jgi:hypothetical protein